MKYKISTDKAIIDHIAKANDGEAVLHACVKTPPLIQYEGIVTSCDTVRRLVTLQMPDGKKSAFSFDHISIPDAS
jgi:hypothetical protein